jgi:hypothetical protein
MIIDVSELATRLGILFPVAVSATLYNYPGMDPKYRIEHLEELLQMGLGSARWLSGDEVGERTYGISMSNGEWTWLVRARAVVERFPDGSGVVATLFAEEESPTLPGLAATFYVN